MRPSQHGYQVVRTIQLGLLAIAGTLGPARAAVTSEVESFTEPFREIQVAAAESGIVQDVRVKQGQSVIAGQALATLDNTVLLTSLSVARSKASATAQLIAAQAELELRERKLQKLESLRVDGHASNEEVDRTRTDVEIARARVMAAKEERELAALEVRQIEAQLARRTIVSPIRGFISRLHKQTGEYVAGNAPEIATVVQLDFLRIKFYVSTHTAQQLSVEEWLPLQFPGTGQSVEGIVEFVSPTTDADSGTVRVEVVLENRDGQYRSGVPVRLGR